MTVDVKDKTAEDRKNSQTNSDKNQEEEKAIQEKKEENVEMVLSGYEVLDAEWWSSLS